MSTLKTIKLQNPSGASSNIDLGVGGEVLIGSASTTGTASQRLQVTGGAYVSGSVGLGTTNPVSKIHIQDGSDGLRISATAVEQTSSSGLTLNGSNASGFIAFRAAGNERVRIDSSGNLGIGVTNPSAVSGAGQGTGIKAEINGSLYLYEGGNTSNHGGGIGFGIATFPSYTPMAQIKGLLINAPATELQGDLAFYTRLSGSAGQTLTERARFTNAGYFKAANNGSYISTGFAWHEFNQSANDTNLALLATNTGQTANCVRLGCSRSQSSSYYFLTLESSGLGNDNEFTFRGDGVASADGSWNGGGADYAEMFEWADGNINNEDRVGYTVSLVGNKIKIAEEGEDIIGVISGNPSVVGDTSWNKWTEKYLKDSFNRYIVEEHNVVEWTDEDGKQHSYEDWNLPEDITVPADATIKTHDEKGNRFVHRKLNPEYNPDQEYITREDRPEWDAVGLVGKLRVRKGQVIGDRWIKMQDIDENVEEWLVR